MKRTKYINLLHMRKAPLIKPLALGIAAATLTACSQKEPVKIVADVEECTEVTEYSLSECQAAYEKALEEAARTGPRYKHMRDCAQEFGMENCVSYQSHGSSWYMPAIAGFMIGQAVSRHYGYNSIYNPVYEYRGRGSYRDKLVTADGVIIGNRGTRSATVSSDALKRKPKAVRTVSRGGFGSTASAKSSWGSSKSRGWGG